MKLVKANAVQRRNGRGGRSAQRDRRGQVRHDLARVVHRTRHPPPGQVL
jgi:hypothetical protein